MAKDKKKSDTIGTIYNRVRNTRAKEVDALVDALSREDAVQSKHLGSLGAKLGLSDAAVAASRAAPGTAASQTRVGLLRRYANEAEYRGKREEVAGEQFETEGRSAEAAGEAFKAKLGAETEQARIGALVRGEDRALQRERMALEREKMAAEKESTELQDAINDIQVAAEESAKLHGNSTIALTDVINGQSALKGKYDDRILGIAAYQVRTAIRTQASEGANTLLSNPELARELARAGRDGKGKIEFNDQEYTIPEFLDYVETVYGTEVRSQIGNYLTSSFNPSIAAREQSKGIDLPAGLPEDRARVLRRRGGYEPDPITERMFG